MSLADYVAKYPRRAAWKAKVEAAWREEPKRPSGTLDSSLKKHTTFLNRLRSLLVSQPEALIKEADTLTLTKYLEEIVAAVIEGCSKGKGDSEVAVEIIVHLHTRLTPDFLAQLLPGLLAVLTVGPTPSAKTAESEKDREREEKERIARQRTALRIVADLAICHGWQEGVHKGVEEIQKAIRGLTSGDPQFVNIPLASAFLKTFGRAYLGQNEDVNEPLPADVQELVVAEQQQEVRKLFIGYYAAASKTLVKGQTKLLEQDKRNHEAYIKSGEIFEDRQQAYEKMSRAVERLTTGVQTLSELLDLPIPTLPTAASIAKSGLQIVEGASSFTVREDGPIAGGIWDDEEEKLFYEELLDLAQFVPKNLLGIKEKSKALDGDKNANAAGQTDISALTDDMAAADEAQKRMEADVRKQLEEIDRHIADGEETSSNGVTAGVSAGMAREASMQTDEPDARIDIQTAEDQVMDRTALEAGAEDAMAAGPTARLNALFAALPDIGNRDSVDKLATEFAFLNSKASRKRLVKFLAAVPKQRTDLLPFYARFVATLDQYMPDVGVGVVEALDEEMRYLQRKKAVRELDGVRLKNCRFFGELAKFKVARPHSILHVLKVFLDDFKANIENISNLLETCGRFLLRFDGTRETAKSMVELMRRKQKQSQLESRQVIMLENAFHQCNPPERVVREVVQLPPMQRYVQYLLHDVLIKRTIDKVIRSLRKMHWEDPEVYDFILTSFTDIWEIKFGNVAFVAALVYDLQRYHPEFTVAVVDEVMENIRVGLEENVFKFNQRRITTIKYLGELYMYRVVNTAIIFDTLWLLLNFGHGEGLPYPGRDSPIDAVDDFFRVRLVCSLLDACGMCFDKGAPKRRLDRFLVVFQLYVLCKAELPMDVDFMLSDTLDTVRPKGKRLKTFSEAAAAMDTILAEDAADAGQQEEEDEDENDELSERGRELPDEALETQYVIEEEVEEEDRSEEESESESESETESEDIVMREHTKDEADVLADADFDREFSRMLVDTADATRRDKRPAVFDSAVPVIRRAPETSPAAEGQMAFTLLSKKGNKQQTRSFAIPVDSAIAVNSMTAQERNKAEQEHLKRLVLQNERRQEQADKLAIQEDARSRGIRLRYVQS